MPALPSAPQSSPACCDRVPATLRRYPLTPPTQFSLNRKHHEISRPANRNSRPIVHWCRGVWDAQAAYYRRPSSRSRGELASSLTRGSACQSTNTTSTRQWIFSRSNFDNLTGSRSLHLGRSLSAPREADEAIKLSGGARIIVALWPRYYCPTRARGELRCRATASAP